MFDFHRSDRGSNPGRGGKISCLRLHYSDNKTELFAYLASHIHLDFRPSDKFVYVTIESDVGLDQDTSLIAPCNHEEADSPPIRMLMMHLDTQCR